MIFDVSVKRFETGRRLVVFTFAFCVCFLGYGSMLYAEDWPTYNHDNRRSGITSEHLTLPFYEQWVFVSRHQPAPAWPAPAHRDIWHKIPSLNPRVTYDRAYHTVIAEKTLYFGSSADDKLYALDTSTGAVRWSFFTGGPIRCAPAVSDGKVYCGSDDGYVYCLTASDGVLQWKYNSATNGRMIPGNGRMISICPVRTGTLIDDGKVFFGSGLFPLEGVGLHSVDAHNGKELWSAKQEQLSPQGYLLASNTRLYVPTGRTSPAVFDRKNGAPLGQFNAPHGDGGTFALLTEDTMVTGPGKKLNSFSVDTQDRILSFDGKFMIADGDNIYLLSDTQLTAYNRPALLQVRKRQEEIAAERSVLADSVKVLQNNYKQLTDQDRTQADTFLGELRKEISYLDESMIRLKESEHIWSVPFQEAYAMILADDLLMCGGDGAVIAFNAVSGKQAWSGDVAGKAYGLAAANGRLFVSTDKGTIHCFGSRKTDTPRHITIENENPFQRLDSLTNVYASAARKIAGELDTTKGYCLMLDCGEGRLMHELAGLTDMYIIGVDEDPVAVHTARNNLDKAGLYGARTSVFQCSPRNLPFTDNFANLVVSDRTVKDGILPSIPGEVWRLVRPYGGKALIGQPEGDGLGLSRTDIDVWLESADRTQWDISDDDGIWMMAHCGRLQGAGEWTHQYAGTGNSASSNEMLVKTPMQLQWFGLPGPRNIIDRHHRPMASLVKDGRIFVPGSNCVMAIDAYNGTQLWNRTTPGSRRVAVFRDSGHLAAASDYVYLAVKDECWGLDAKSGETRLKFPVPHPSEAENRQWGYLAYADKYLYGSAMKENASRYGMDYDTIMGGTYWDKKPLVTSDYLFCLDRHSGEKVWDYKRGVIPHSAISISDEHIYFFESTNPLAFSDTDGRVRLDFMLGDGCGHIVKLDRETGSGIFDVPVDFPFDHVMFLSYKDDMLVFVGTLNKFDGVYYKLYGFDAGNGEKVWENEYKYSSHTNGDHGEQDQHPVIIGDTIYSRPYDFNLYTGQKGTFDLIRGGHGCGTISGSVNYLFGRGGNPRMYNLEENGAHNTPLSLVNRPGCYINMIPACGLILIPESSSGCTCAYPIQTSVAFAPVNNR